MAMSMRWCLLLATCAGMPGWSQTPAATNKSAQPISESVQRAADSPFRWILINSKANKTGVPVKDAKEAKDATKADKERAASRDVQDAKPTLAPSAAAALANHRQEKDAPPAHTSETGTAAVNPARVPSTAAPSPITAQAPGSTASAPTGTTNPPALTAQASGRAEPASTANDELIAMHQPAPSVSAALMRDGMKGVVRIEFTVEPSGNTSGVKVVHSTARALNTASVNAVRQWRFRPIDEAQTAQIEFSFNYDPG